MYSATTELKTLLTPSEVFKNIDEEYCPVLSYIIKNAGCKTDYSGGIISLNKKIDTQAKLNSEDEDKAHFCIEIKNKDQVLEVDNITLTICRSVITPSVAINKT